MNLKLLTVSLLAVMVASSIALTGCKNTTNTVTPAGDEAMMEEPATDADAAVQEANQAEEAADTAAEHAGEAADAAEEAADEAHKTADEHAAETPAEHAEHEAAH